MGLGRVRDAEGQYLDIPRYARVMCAVVAAAAGVEAIDTVFTDIADLDGLRRECEEGVAMGFTGKISIHPAPDRGDQRRLHAGEGSGRRRRASWWRSSRATPGTASTRSRFKGQMVDAPHLNRAKKLLARAGVE